MAKGVKPNTLNLDITVPGVVNPFPGNGKQGRILLHDGVSLPD
jgi:hypothetical protein